MAGAAVVGEEELEGRVAVGVCLKLQAQLSVFHSQAQQVAVGSRRLPCSLQHKGRGGSAGEEVAEDADLRARAEVQAFMVLVQSDVQRQTPVAAVLHP
eukprot:756267-Hanusia_phi.AAC.1